MLSLFHALPPEAGSFAAHAHTALRGGGITLRLFPGRARTRFRNCFLSFPALTPEAGSFAAHAHTALCGGGITLRLSPGCARTHLQRCSPYFIPCRPRPAVSPRRAVPGPTSEDALYIFCFDARGRQFRRARVYGALRRRHNAIPGTYKRGLPEGRPLFVIAQPQNGPAFSDY